MISTVTSKYYSCLRIRSTIYSRSSSSKSMIDGKSNTYITTYIKNNYVSQIYMSSSCQPASLLQLWFWPRLIHSPDVELESGLHISLSSSSLYFLCPFFFTSLNPMHQCSFFICFLVISINKWLTYLPFNILRQMQHGSVFKGSKIKASAK